MVLTAHHEEAHLLQMPTLHKAIHLLEMQAHCKEIYLWEMSTFTMQQMSGHFMRRLRTQDSQFAYSASVPFHVYLELSHMLVNRDIQQAVA